MVQDLDSLAGSQAAWGQYKGLGTLRYQLLGHFCHYLAPVLLPVKQVQGKNDHLELCGVAEIP